MTAAEAYWIWIVIAKLQRISRQWSVLCVLTDNSIMGTIIRTNLEESLPTSEVTGRAVLTESHIV